MCIRRLQKYKLQILPNYLILTHQPYKIKKLQDLPATFFNRYLLISWVLHNLRVTVYHILRYRVQVHF